MFNPDQSISLRKYFLHFTWIYFSFAVAIYIIVFLLVDYFVLVNEELFNSASMALSMGAVMLTSHLFVKKQQRFFTKPELKKMILGTTFIEWLFSAVFFIPIFIVDFDKYSTIPFWLWLIMLCVSVAYIYFIHWLSFFVARRSFKSVK